MSLSPERLERFARHIVLPEVGGAGQAALARKHLVLVGLGGIGSPALQYLADACVRAGVPLLSAAVGRFQGQVGAFAGHLPHEACYRCFVGDAFDAEDCDTCAEDGMLGAMAGWVATFASLHAIRVLLDGASAYGDPQWSRVNLLDGMKPGMRQFTIAKDPECKGCGSGG